MKKTLWLFCIAALFICITPLSAHAAEKEETIVQHTVEGSYVIKIPDCIEADAESLPLTISNVIIPYDHELAVTVDYDGELKLTEEQSVKLAYQLYADDKEIETGGYVLNVQSGTPDKIFSADIAAKVTDKPRYAGIYESIAFFNVEIYEQTRTDYTSEEIANDEHLEAIGSTKPEYVVARFNDDYSSVTITANGEESDGVMKSWTARGSVFTEHKDTLNLVKVKNGVTKVGKNAFYECAGIKIISLPDSIKAIGDSAFYRCAELAEIYLSDNITSIGKSCFYGCSSLKQADLPKELRKIESSTFYSCSSLEKAILGEKVESIGANAFTDCKALKSITIPDSVKEIGGWAFRSSGLRSMIIPDSVTALGTSAFANCDQMESIKLPENVKEIPKSLLNYCYSLQSVDIPDNVTSIGDWAFANCTDLEELKLPNNLMSIGRLSFSGMQQLNRIEIDEENAYFCTVDGVLYDKTKTTLLLYPSAKPGMSFRIPESVLNTAESCIGRCKELKHLYVPSTVINIEEGMFGNMVKPLVHTPAGSAMEAFCVNNDISYDNNME